MRRHPKMALLALVTTVLLLSGACGGDEEQAQPGDGAEGVQVTPTAGGEDLLDEETPVSPTPGGGTPATPEETGSPPPPGEATEAEFVVQARGTDPAEGRVLPVILLATTPQEGAAVAGASPAPGAGEVVGQWDEYGERAVVAVLGGSQPDSGYRVAVTDVNVVKNGSLLLVSGRIERQKGPASQVISIPWVILSVPAESADTVTKCTLALEAAPPFSTACP